MWHLPAPRLAEAFRYPEDAGAAAAAGVAVPSFWEFYAQVIIPVIIWGCGTALGELPPYLVSYSAAKAGEVPLPPRPLHPSSDAGECARPLRCRSGFRGRGAPTAARLRRADLAGGEESG